MENQRVQFDDIDIDQLHHIQEELARLRNDMAERSRAYRKLDTAIDQIDKAIETGNKTTINNGIFLEAEDLLPNDDSENSDQS